MKRLIYNKKDTLQQEKKKTEEEKKGKKDMHLGIGYTKDPISVGIRSYPILMGIKSYQMSMNCSAISSLEQNSFKPFFHISPS